MVTLALGFQLLSGEAYASLRLDESQDDLASLHSLKLAFKNKIIEWFGLEGTLKMI